MGWWPWKKLLTASTSTAYVDLARKRHVSRSDRIRSTQRLPLLLAVPNERLRQSTPQRKARLQSVVRGVHPVVGEKHPERVHLAEQAMGQLPRVVLTIMILLNCTRSQGSNLWQTQVMALDVSLSLSTLYGTFRMIWHPMCDR